MISMTSSPLSLSLAAAADQYGAGVCRDRVVHDLILADAARLGEGLTFLDIGCGKGFDTDVPLQESLVRASGTYIGVEPDPAVTIGEHIRCVHRCFFEQVELQCESVHVAFAIMVLEHLADPQPFWDKLHEVLTPGGIFWALTVDARHWFCRTSRWMERLRLKELYLSCLMGARGRERYENYPVYYHCNTPERVAAYTQAFSFVQCLNLARIGQCDDLFPGLLRPLSRQLEKRRIRRGKPGTLLVIRAVK
jgi:SAM-dependent methyltransferase